MISNEHPEIFERLGWDADLPRRVGARPTSGCAAPATMRVTSAAGTDLTRRPRRRVHRRLDRGHRRARARSPTGRAGWCSPSRPPTRSNGTLVLAPGDLNLTFNRIVESPIELTIVDDHITEIGGDGVDAQLFRSYLASFGDRASYATSHVGWGMNQAARWEAVELYDRRETWGTEARAFAGNFLYSTGANESRRPVHRRPLRPADAALHGHPRRHRRGRAAASWSPS